MDISTHVVDPDSQIEYAVPSYSTPEETLKRERAIAAGEFRVMQMPAAELDSALQEDDPTGYNPLDIETLPLSPPVVARLKSWMAVAQEHFDPFIAPPTETVRSWQLEGDALFAQVVEELWSTALVTRAWTPLSATDHRYRAGMKVLELGTGRLVSDLIPRSHAHLRVQRVFFPFETKAGELVPWTRFVPADRAFSASTTWHDLLESAGKDPADFNPASGQLDERTAEGLRTLIGDRTMTGLMWRGYSGTSGEPDYRATTWSNGTEVYISHRFTADFIRAGMQVPEFAWDDEGGLAWGGFLYPDSLAVAVEPERLNALYGSGLLTATGALPEDTMPASSGD